MKRAYKFRAYPTRPQESRAVRLLASITCHQCGQLEKLPPSGRQSSHLA